jgi:hypothetical protein
MLTGVMEDWFMKGSLTTVEGGVQGIQKDY